MIKKKSWRFYYEDNDGDDDQSDENDNDSDDDDKKRDRKFRSGFASAAPGFLPLIINHNDH